MKLLTMPRRVGNFGDAAIDFPTFTPEELQALPTTSTGAIDFTNMTLPGPTFTASDFDLSLPKSVGPLDLSAIANQIVKGAQTYYGAQAAVNTANYAAQLSKAKAQAALNITKAGGTNAARTAGAGLPSPTLLLFAGLGLAAVLVLKK